MFGWGKRSSGTWPERQSLSARTHQRMHYDRQYDSNAQATHYDSRRSPTSRATRRDSSPRPLHWSHSQHTTTRHHNSLPGNFDSRWTKRDGDSRYSPDLTEERTSSHSNGDLTYRGSFDLREERNLHEDMRDFEEESRQRHVKKRKRDNSRHRSAKKMKRSKSRDEYSVKFQERKEEIEDEELVGDIKETIAEIVKTILRATPDKSIPIKRLFYELKCQKINVRTKKGLRKLLIEFPQCFLVNKRMQVSAMTNLKICENQGCSCQSLHFCKYDLLDKCTFGKCKFNHDLTLANNKHVLREHYLHHLDHRELRRIVSSKESRNPSTLPTVCKFYNNAGGCGKATKCDRLNVCLKFITDDCKFGYNCKRSHYLHDRQPSAVLRRYGILIELVEDVDELRMQIKSTLGKDGSIIHRKRTNTDESVEPSNKASTLIKRYFLRNHQFQNHC